MKQAVHKMSSGNPNKFKMKLILLRINGRLHCKI